MRKSQLLVGAAGLALLSASAIAHPGHPLPTDGVLAGLAHPWSGADHLLTMLLVGVWAAQLGRAAVWAVPGTFLALMAAGAAMAAHGPSPSFLEAGIGVSLVILGVAVAVGAKLPTSLAMAAVGAFALLHGAAHGAEASGSAAFIPYVCGFLVSTAALHGLGVCLGIYSNRHSPAITRVLGVFAALFGMVTALA